MLDPSQFTERAPCRMDDRSCWCGAHWASSGLTLGTSFWRKAEQSANNCSTGKKACSGPRCTCKYLEYRLLSTRWGWIAATCSAHCLQPALAWAGLQRLFQRTVYSLSHNVFRAGFAASRLPCAA